jgi:hypothetical protein
VRAAAEARCLEGQVQTALVQMQRTCGSWRAAWAGLAGMQQQRLQQLQQMMAWTLKKRLMPLLLLVMLVAGVPAVLAVCMQQQQQSMGMQRVTATWMLGWRKKQTMMMMKLQRRTPFSALA